MCVIPASYNPWSDQIIPGAAVDEVERAKNRSEPKVRAKIEHPIGVIKLVFGFARVRGNQPNAETPGDHGEL